MNNLITMHPPTTSYGVVGCAMYDHVDSIKCYVANSEGNFQDIGIVDDSLVFVQRKLPFKRGALNVFKLPGYDDTPYKISKTMLKGEYVGRALMVINQYE